MSKANETIDHIKHCVKNTGTSYQNRDSEGTSMFEQGMPDVKECLIDIESEGVEEMPKLILKYPNEALVYVYKNKFGRSWLEYTPTVDTKEEDNLLLKRLGYRLHKPVEYASEQSANSCISINITDEEEFLIQNM